MVAAAAFALGVGGGNGERERTRLLRVLLEGGIGRKIASRLRVFRRRVIHCDNGSYIVD